VTTREERLKAGGFEDLRWPGYRLTLYYEVWSEVKPPHPTFIVELESNHGLIREYKAAFDTLAEADEDFERMKRKYAVEIAKTALRLRRLN